MTTVVIPKLISNNQDLVAVPRDIFKEFVDWQRKVKSVKTFTMTVAEKKRLQKARRNLARGDFMTLDQLKNALGIKGR